MIRSASRGPMLGVLLALWACESDVNIVAECSADLQPFIARSPGPGEGGLSGASVGILGDDVLVSWTRLGDRDLDGFLIEANARAQWFTTEGQAVSERLELGQTFDAFRTRWVATDQGLRGQVWADPSSPDVPALQIRQERLVHVWTMTPDASSYERILFDTVPPWTQGARQITIAYPGSLAHEVLPASGGRTPRIAFIAIPDACAQAIGNYNRLFVQTDGSDAVPMPWPNPLCELHRHMMSNPWLFELDDGRSAALLRIGQSGPLYYLGFGGDGLPNSPRGLGGGMGDPNSEGHQARAVAVEGARVLFTDGGADPRCFRLRIMADDGTDAEDTPWQLPCHEDSSIVTTDVDLVPGTHGGAVLVWSERSVASLVDRGRTGYQEAVYATYLLPNGKRGSNVFRVTDEAASSLYFFWGVDQTVPGFFIPTAASQDDRVAVTWMDQREGAPGLYVRTFQCRRTD